MFQTVVSTPRARSIALLLGVVLFVTSCSGGPRPTLTDDRIAEDAPLSSPVPVAAATQLPSASADGPEDQAAEDPAVSAATTPADGIERLVIEVVETFPHDQQAFTQGLELHDGVLFESTGLEGQSDIRRTDVTTGEVLLIAETPSNFFAEGLTKVGDELIQLTWKNNTAFYWDADTLELNRQVSYDGEGWGLCFDGQWLVMTDGLPELIFRDPVTFDEITRVPVTRDGVPVARLNEVECVDGVVWANIWTTDEIVRIDPVSGQVTGSVDAASIRFDGQSGAVLNGIAWDSATNTFLVTGKLWPTMYRVNFVPAAAN